jgi:hypothetical protein
MRDWDFLEAELKPVTNDWSILLGIDPFRCSRIATSDQNHRICNPNKILHPFLTQNKVPFHLSPQLFPLTQKFPVTQYMLYGII